MAEDNQVQEDTQATNLTEALEAAVRIFEGDALNSQQQTDLETMKRYVAAMSPGAAAEVEAGIPEDILTPEPPAVTALNGREITENEARAATLVFPNAAPKQTDILVAWFRAEGDPGDANINEYFNPGNVASPLTNRIFSGQRTEGGPFGDGFWNHINDDLGVVMFDDIEHGAAATSDVLHQSNMADMLAALVAEDAEAFANALASSPWGTNPDAFRREYGI